MSGRSNESPTPSPSAQPLSVALIGAGIASLSIALSLHHTAPHIKYTIYESHSTLSPASTATSGFYLTSNAGRALRLISPSLAQAFARIRTTCEDPKLWMELRTAMASNAPASEGKGKPYAAEDLIVAIFDPSKDVSGGVTRSGLLEAAAELLPDFADRVQFCKRLVGLEQITKSASEGAGVRLTFEDGTTATHAAVLGCDGVKSATRRCMFPAGTPGLEPVFTSHVCRRALVPMDMAVSILGHHRSHNSTAYLWHGHYLITFPVAQGKLLNFGAFSIHPGKWPHGEKWIVPGSKDALLEDFEGVGETLKKLLEVAQATDVWALFDLPPLEKYCAGNVCLMGDAAHASTPHQGAGAGLAVEDAYVMGRLMAEVCSAEDFSAAFAAFDESRRPRTQKIVSTSRQAQEWVQFMRNGVGDDIERIRGEWETRMQWVWDHDLQAEAQDVISSFRRWLES